MSLTVEVYGGFSAEARAASWYGPSVLRGELYKHLDALLKKIDSLPADGGLNITLTAEVTS